MQTPRAHFPDSLESTNLATHPLTKKNLAAHSLLMNGVKQITGMEEQSPRTPWTKLLSQTPQKHDTHRTCSQSKRKDSEREFPPEGSSDMTADPEGWTIVEKEHEAALRSESNQWVLVKREKRVKIEIDGTDHVAVEEGREPRRSMPDAPNRGSKPRAIHPCDSGFVGTPMPRENGVSRSRTHSRTRTRSVPLDIELEIDLALLAADRISISALLVDVGAQFPESRPFTGIVGGDWIDVR